MAYAATRAASPLRVVLASALLLAAAASEPARSAEPERTTIDATHDASNPCVRGPGQHRTVTAVTGAAAVALDDGTEIKLAGLIGVSAFDASVAVQEWPPEQQAIGALSALLLGRTVAVHPVTPRTDRYRRLVAHLFVERDDARHWVQGTLLAGGHARAYAPTETPSCVDRLLAHEREARHARRGIWANAAYFERAAYRTRELMRLRGTFQIISGRIRKVSEVKSAIYLNFGTDWQSDFTAGIRLGKGAAWETSFTEMVRALEGRRVRVRGWIDRRNGPYIEIGHPSELEVIDGDTVPRTVPAVAGASLSGNEKRPEP